MRFGASASVVIMAFWLACQPGVAQAAKPELPGVDLKDLDQDETAILMSILKEQFDPCGTPRSFLDAAKAPKDCKLATKLANFVVGQIQRGLSKRQIVKALLKEIKRLTVRHKFTLKGRPFIGPEKAKVTVVEFFDFQCPHCKQVAEELPALIKKKKGVRVVYKQYPLDFHPAAKVAAITAVAAQAQGKWKVLHDKLFDEQDSLTNEKVAELAKKVGVDAAKLEKEQKAAARIVKMDRREGDLANVEGTPSFFVNGLLVDYEELEAAIDKALKGK